MKRFIFYLVATFVLVAFSNAQSLDYEVKGTEVIFTHILEDTGLSIKDANDAIEAYYAKAFGDVNYTIKLNQEDHIIYKAIFPKVQYVTFGAGSISIPYTMEISLKNNRMRMKIIVEEANLEFINTTTLGNLTEYNRSLYLVDIQPIGEGKGNRLSKKEELAIFDNMCERILTVFSNLDKAMKNVKVDDDW